MTTNPFTPNDPATTSIFAGRATELRFLCEQLNAVKEGRTRKLLITGERGIGKTSLVNYLESYARGETPYKNTSFRFLVVNVKISENTSTTELLTAIETGLRTEIDNICKMLKIAKATWEFLSKWSILGVEYKDGQQSATVVKDLAITVVELIKTTVANLKNQDSEKVDGVLLVFDECDRAGMELNLGEFTKLFSEKLGPNSSTMLVLSGLPKVRKVLQKSHASALRALQDITLGRLQQEEIDDLIVRCMASQIAVQGKTLSEEARGLLVNLAEGFPYFAQEYGSFAFDEALGDLIDSEDVHKSAIKPNGAIQRIAEVYNFQGLFESLDPIGKEILKKTAPESLNGWFSSKSIKMSQAPSQVTESLRSIVRKGILIKKPDEDGKFRFRWNAFVYWLKLRTTNQIESWQPAVDIFNLPGTKPIRDENIFERKLSDLGIDTSEIKLLLDAIAQDGGGSFGSNVAKWIEKLIRSSTQPGSGISHEDAIINVPNIIRSYIEGNSI